jgi:hypothetical protein
MSEPEVLDPDAFIEAVPLPEPEVVFEPEAETPAEADPPIIADPEFEPEAEPLVLAPVELPPVMEVPTFVTALVAVCVVAANAGIASVPRIMSAPEGIAIIRFVIVCKLRLVKVVCP